MTRKKTGGRKRSSGRVKTGGRIKGIKDIEEKMIAKRPESYEEAKWQMEKMMEGAKPVHFEFPREHKIEVHKVTSHKQLPLDAVGVASASVYDYDYVLRGWVKSKGVDQLYILEVPIYNATGGFEYTQYQIYATWRTKEDINDEIRRLKEYLEGGFGGYYIGNELNTYELSSETKYEIHDRIMKLELTRDYTLPRWWKEAQKAKRVRKEREAEESK